MFTKNTILDYPLLLIKSTGKKNFSAMSEAIQKSGDTVSRLLRPAAESFNCMARIAKKMFLDAKNVVLQIDDTLIKKIFSQYMEGSGRFFDTKIGRKILAYKLLVMSVTNGKYTLPLWCEFLFDKDLMPAENLISKNDLVKSMILYGQKIFPDKHVITALDGIFATIELLNWAVENGIALECRMHRNRVVKYKKKDIAICEIKELTPKGRQMSRTIQVEWHDIPIYITAQRRFDKHGEGSIVFQVATYKNTPSGHVKVYKKRWGIEKMFRTTKQHLGLQECFSTKMEVQLNHMANVLLAYSLVQIEMKKRKFATPEEALRALKRKKLHILKHRFGPASQIFEDFYA